MCMKNVKLCNDGLVCLAVAFGTSISHSLYSNHIFHGGCFVITSGELDQFVHTKEIVREFQELNASVFFVVV